MPSTGGDETAAGSSAERFYTAIAGCEKATWTIPKNGNEPPIRHEVVGNVGGKCKVLRTIADIGTWTCQFSKAELDTIRKFKGRALAEGDPFHSLLQNEKTCPMSPPSP